MREFVSVFSSRIVACWEPEIIRSPIIAVKILLPPIIRYTAQTDFLYVKVKLDLLKVISHKFKEPSKSRWIFKYRLPVTVNKSTSFCYIVVAYQTRTPVSFGFTCLQLYGFS